MVAGQAVMVARFVREILSLFFLPSVFVVCFVNGERSISIGSGGKTKLDFQLILVQFYDVLTHTY